MPRLPSMRSMARSAMPSPRFSDRAPLTLTTAASPMTGSPISTRSASMLRISTPTGNSGRAKSCASARRSGVSAPSGRRGSSMRAAESSSTSTRRARSAERFHWIAPSCSASQTPLSSAIVIRSNVARELSAPLKPVIVTFRPAPDRFSSSNRVRKPRSSSTSAEISAALSVCCAAAGSGISSGSKAIHNVMMNWRIRMPAPARYRPGCPRRCRRRSGRPRRDGSGRWATDSARRRPRRIASRSRR